MSAAAPSPLARWVDRWIARRHGPRGGDVRLERRRLYVLPTRAGLGFAGLALVMLVTSVNYGLGLGFALTFLLVSLALVGMLHTHRNLAGLTLRAGRGEPVFAGDPAVLQLLVKNPSRVDRFAITISAPASAQPVPLDVPAGTEQTAQLAFPAVRRGWLAAPRLQVQTRFPLGLCRAWSWWHPAARVLVYPAPETPAAPLPAAANAADGPSGPGRGNEDFAALRPWREGDPLRRIAWRAVARDPQAALVSKQFDGSARGELWLDWAAVSPRLDAESALSRLARWVIDAESAGVRFGLRLPGVEIPPDAGPGQRARCLEALALARV